VKTVLLSDVAIKAGRDVVRQSIIAKSFFLQDRELNKIGTQNKCLKCGELFTIGEAELHKYSHDPKGAPKRNLELCTQSEAWVDVNLSLNPIDLSKYSVQDQAIIYGVECIEMHVCRECSKENKQYREQIGGMSGHSKSSVDGVEDDI
jgi:hypothetical protein